MMRQPSTPQEVKPAGFDEIDAAELAETEGGVAPTWDAQGNMIGCTGRVLTTALNKLFQRVFRL